MVKIEKLEISEKSIAAMYIFGISVVLCLAGNSEIVNKFISGPVGSKR